MLRRLLATALAPAAAALLLLVFPEPLRELVAQPGARLLVEVLRAAAWILPLLVALLCWRHGRSRLVFAALTLSATALAGSPASPGLDPGEPLTGLVLLAATAVTFLAIAPIEERGLLTRAGLPRLLAFATWVGALGWLLRFRPDWLEWVLQPLGVAVRPYRHGPWTLLGLCLAVAAGAACLAARRRDREEVGSALFFALACALAGSSSAHGFPAALRVPLGPTCFALAGSFVLLQGLHALAWRHGNRDELTGLPSRRALEERLPRLSGSYTVAVLDLDRFKQVNDRHGHEAGDAVLRTVADRLRRFEGGTFFRSGGEEFVAILPGLDLDAAAERLDRLRQDIAGRRTAVTGLPGRKPRDLGVTVSIGAAQRSRRDPSPERVIAAADSALLRAKKGGRDRVCLERRSLPRRKRREAPKGARNG